MILTIAGALVSFLPEVVRFFKNREEFKHEQRMFELQLQNAEKLAQFEFATIQARADADEGKALLLHDSSLDGKGFIGALRASVRPVITYLFFFVFVMVKIVAGYIAMEQGYSFIELAPIIWDEDTKSLFSAIIGFWFGSRVIEKYRSRHDNKLVYPTKLNLPKGLE